MFKSARSRLRNSALLSLFILALVTTLVVLPGQFRSGATVTGAGLVERTTSWEDEFPNFDIREEKNEEIVAAMSAFRSASRKEASDIADIRDGFVVGENALRAKVPTLNIEYNTNLRTPEIIGTDVRKGRTFLTEPVASFNGRNAGIVKEFLKRNTELVGMERDQIDLLKTFADYTNPNGDMAFVELEQHINGIEVFGGTVKAAFARTGEMVQINNNLAPGLDYSQVSRTFGDPAAAYHRAASNVGVGVTRELSGRQSGDKRGDDNKVAFGKGESADTAEKMYFPVEPGVIRPAWRVLVHKDVAAYYVLIDAETGTVLWRKNLVNDQTESATYNVYRNTTSMLQAPDSPAPITPGPVNPTLGTQGVQIERSDVTLIGNESWRSFNNLGWITDGTNGTDGHTIGNNVEAGLDLVAPDGIEAPQAGTGRVFSFDYNPPPGFNGTTPDEVTTDASRSGAVTQLFYLCNQFHDIMYQLGFTEEARNFQQDNFGRGGLGNDRVSCQAQDYNGTNNANFLTPSDGTRGRMQMYRFTNTPINRDGTIDADIVVHEFTHGLTNRLIGNAGGLSNNRGGGMGEGWSDYYAIALMTEPTDPIQGIYTTGAYATFNVFGLGSTNSYYGIRRMPYAVMSFTGGPQNRPHDSRTAGDVNIGCSLADGAFPPSFTGTCDQVHNTGEVWVSMLMEARGEMMQRLGVEAGNRRMLEIVTNGLKMTPNAPTFETARNAVISAALAMSPAAEAKADADNVWRGFARRGLGFIGTDNGSQVVENYDEPNVILNDPFEVDDSVGNNNGFYEPGEAVLLKMTAVNLLAEDVEEVIVSVVGGGSQDLGTVAEGANLVVSLPYTIPADAACGSIHEVEFVVTSDLGTQTPVKRNFRIGVPVGGAPVTFENNTAITIATTAGPGNPYPSTINVSGASGQKLIKVELTNFSHTWMNDVDILLEGPGGQKFIMFSDAFGGSSGGHVSTFTIHDGAENLMPSVAPVIAGSWKPTNHGANDPFVTPAPAGPYENAAPAGSATFASVFGVDGSAMNGDWKLWVVDDANQDGGQIAGGWKITLEADDYDCSGVASNVAVGGRVTSSNGRGIANAYVTVTDGGTTMVAVTNAFGYYNFPAIPGGVLYTVTPARKGYSFTPQQLTPNANVTDLNFVGS